MQDGEIVTAIVAGEPAGLAAAYDKYAPQLYAYCRSLLSEPADAADAVQDTFLVAVGKVDGLRDPDRFRAWLYAVARNECLRRLRAQGLSAPLDAAAELTDDEPDPASGPEREELRTLVRAALAGLNPPDREVIELNLRHTLDGDDLADALGVSRNQALALAARARAQFEGSLGALLAARVGRDYCPDLDDILAGWDGALLTIVLRKRINRHLQRCGACGERRRRELSPAMLLSLLPMVVLPPGLRARVLRLAADTTPTMVGHRDLVARRAGPFDRDGFPKPIGPPRRVYGVRTLTVAASVAAIAAALLGTGTLFVLDALHHKGATPVAAATFGATTPPAPQLATGSTPAGTRHRSAGHKQGQPTTVTLTSPTPAATRPSQPGSQPSQPNQGPPSPGHSHTPTPPPPPPPSPGTLALSSTAVTLAQDPTTGAYTGSFTLTAQGGTVDGYSIQDPALAGDLSISPLSGGTLDEGQSVTVTISVADPTGLAYETDLTVSPGVLTVQVFYPPAGG